MNTNDIFVIKVGGSVLSPNEENIFSFEEANNFKILLNSLVERGKRFILITGGGYLARSYQKLLKDNNYPIYDQHYVGTLSCILNAVMLRAVLGDLAEERVLALSDYERLENIKFNKPILVAGVERPGPSSDKDSAVLAKHFNAKSVISMKNINGVYDSDPKKNPEAKHLDAVTWERYLNIIGDKVKHTPGDNLPVDPIAANFSKENNINFIILDGRDRNALRNAIEGSDFIGTTIHN